MEISYSLLSRLDGNCIAEFPETDKQIVDLRRGFRRECEIEDDHVKFSSPSYSFRLPLINLILYPHVHTPQMQIVSGEPVLWVAGAFACLTKRASGGGRPLCTFNVNRSLRHPSISSSYSNNITVNSMAPPILPDDVLHLLCEELALQERFDTLFNCACANRGLAVPALTNLYRYVYIYIPCTFADWAISHPVEGGYKKIQLSIRGPELQLSAI